jgi:hypothetical protein
MTDSGMSFCGAFAGRVRVRNVESSISWMCQDARSLTYGAGATGERSLLRARKYPGPKLGRVGGCGV